VRAPFALKLELDGTAADALSSSKWKCSDLEFAEDRGPSRKQIVVDRDGLHESLPACHSQVRQPPVAGAPVSYGASAEQPGGLNAGETVLGLCGSGVLGRDGGADGQGDGREGERNSGVEGEGGGWAEMGAVFSPEIKQLCADWRILSKTF